MQDYTDSHYSSPLYPRNANTPTLPNKAPGLQRFHSQYQKESIDPLNFFEKMSYQSLYSELITQEYSVFSNPQEEAEDDTNVHYASVINLLTPNANNNQQEAYSNILKTSTEQNQATRPQRPKVLKITTHGLPEVNKTNKKTFSFSEPESSLDPALLKQKNNQKLSQFKARLMLHQYINKNGNQGDEINSAADSFQNNERSPSVASCINELEKNQTPSTNGSNSDIGEVNCFKKEDLKVSTPAQIDSAKSKKTLKLKQHVDEYFKEPVPKQMEGNMQVLDLLQQSINYLKDNNNESNSACKINKQ